MTEPGPGRPMMFALGFLAGADAILLLILAVLLGGRQRHQPSSGLVPPFPSREW